MKHNKNTTFEIKCLSQGLIISEMKRFHIAMRTAMVKNYMMLKDSVIAVNIKRLDNKTTQAL